MFKKSLIALSLAIVATGSFAQGMTFQGAIGPSNISTDWPNGAAPTALSSSKASSTGGKLVVGFEQMPGFVWEVGYYNFGEAKATYGTAGDATHTTSGFIANAVWTGKKDKFSARGGIGLPWLQNKITDRPGGTYTSSTNSLTLFPTLTAGIGYELAPTMEITADLDLARSKYTTNTGDTKYSNARLISVGLRVKY